MTDCTTLILKGSKSHEKDLKELDDKKEKIQKRASDVSLKKKKHLKKKQ